MESATEVHESIDVIEAHLGHRLGCERALSEGIQGMLLRSTYLRDQNEHLLHTLAEAHTKTEALAVLLLQSRKRHAAIVDQLTTSQATELRLSEEIISLKRNVEEAEDKAAKSLAAASIGATNASEANGLLMRRNEALASSMQTSYDAQMLMHGATEAKARSSLEAMVSCYTEVLSCMASWLLLASKREPDVVTTVHHTDAVVAAPPQHVAAATHSTESKNIQTDQQQPTQVEQVQQPLVVPVTKAELFVDAHDGEGHEEANALSGRSEDEVAAVGGASSERASQLESVISSLQAENQNLRMKEGELKAFLLKLEAELIAHREHKGEQQKNGHHTNTASAAKVKHQSVVSQSDVSPSGHGPNSAAKHRRASAISVTSSSASQLLALTPVIKPQTPPPTAKSSSRAAASTSTTPKLAPTHTSHSTPSKAYPKAASAAGAHVSNGSAIRSAHQYLATRGGVASPPPQALRAASPSNFHYPGAPPPPTSIPKSYVSQVLHGLKKDGAHGSMVDLLAPQAQPKSRGVPPPSVKPPPPSSSPKEVESTSHSKAPPPNRATSKSPYRPLDSKVPAKAAPSTSATGFKKASPIASA